MNTLTYYRQLIQKILTEYTRTPYAYGDIQFETVFDRESDRYLVMILGRENMQRVHGCLLHLDIIDEKIWIQRDGTQEGIVNELLSAGIPKEKIVMGFRSPAHRTLTELAVVEEVREAYLLQDDTNPTDARWDDLFADPRSEDVFLAFAKEARETDEADLWSLEESGL
ncbi:MAG: XisI protein [Caldilineaceae bacterium]|nr:XisI protein [Caldilineaceae bacterium]